ncbi:hypothetical protein PPYR_15557 [Photinus pyralis]|uniref:DUF7869 domain-containing protein n=1 Tax=Photinus pyralis TaxID=7054 RepID=A0A5N3ZYI5_PHOPY|nr:uncharacterized protein LOC116182341 [Photinus pyralis]XP_031359100.1 uncharacterized protein LOC116182698 [Photinus pyralis]KAB0790124.1 hypothetical protein PPYR_15557 [Photinus pyralis]
MRPDPCEFENEVIVMDENQYETQIEDVRIRMDNEGVYETEFETEMIAMDENECESEIEGSVRIDKERVYETEFEQNIRKDNEDEYETELEENAKDNESSGGGKRKRAKRKVPQQWKKNVRKNKRNAGESYLTTAGKVARERRPKNLGETCKCKRECHLKIRDEDKISISKSFWDMKDLSRQRDFIAARVRRQLAERGRVESSRRKFSQTFSLLQGGTEHQVCKYFFLQTLDISEKMVRTSVEKSARNAAGIPSPDKRGRHTPANKHAEDEIVFAINHIDSFPRVPAHWCRRDTKKEYLETILNKEKMYNLYLEHCITNKKKPISRTNYKEILIEKNIGFHKPKKDQCWCHHFEQLPADQKTDRQAEFDLHIRRKCAANEEKRKDSEKSKTDDTYLSANFDLEAVLYSPLFHAKPIFYKRKLATFNFTIYEVPKRQGHSYIWTEFEGNRGSNEIATCLNKFIHSISNTVRHLVLYSDCCPGQNRNAVVACMLQQAVCLVPHLKIIDLKFLEPGHTHMECDSMHAAIERASEKSKIFWPDDWINIVILSNKKNPFKVSVLHHDDFLDYKDLQGKIMVNKKKADDGSILSWKEVKWLRFDKEQPNVMQYKSEYWEEEFKRINTGRRGRKPTARNSSYEMKKAYTDQIPIQKKKFNDLQQMCHGKDKIIPRQYHQYYRSLPVQAGNTNSEDYDSEDEVSLQVMKERYLQKK